MRAFVRRFVPLLLSGLFITAVIAPPSLAQADPYDAYVAEASRRFGIPAAWIRAVMRTESAGKKRATSSAGAMGLMQIMPLTWAELSVRHGLGRDPYDPRDNILAGTAYLRELHDRYGAPGFLAAYNAGPRRYEQSLTGRPLPVETRAYVATLRPIVGVSGNESTVMPTGSNPFVWARSPLFIVQSDRAFAAVSVPTKRALNDRSVISDVRDIPAIVPPSSGLFAARASSGEPR